MLHYYPVLYECKAYATPFCCNCPVKFRLLAFIFDAVMYGTVNVLNIDTLFEFMTRAAGVLRFDVVPIMMRVG